MTDILQRFAIRSSRQGDPDPNDVRTDDRH